MDNNVIAQALRLSRRMTEMLTLGETPSRESIADLDRHLQHALSEIDSPVARETAKAMA